MTEEPPPLSAALAAIPEELRRLLAPSVLRAGALLAVVFLAKFLFPPTTVQAVIEMRSTSGGNGELFYASGDQGYAAEHRLGFKIRPDGNWHKYRLQIPEHRGISKLRIDPGSEAGEVSFRSIEVRSLGKSTALRGTQLSPAVHVSNALEAMPGAADELRFVAKGGDLYVGFLLPPGAGEIGSGKITERAFTAAATAGMAWLIGDMLLVLALAWLWAQARIRELVLRACAALSDDGVVRVTPAVVVFLTLLSLAAIVYVSLDLNQSSMEAWEDMYPHAPVAQAIELGTPKRIRADEWNVSTPWLLGQVARGAPIANENVGGERAPLLAFLPTKHSSALAQVKFFGFLLFDEETGFSWYWAYKTFGLIFASFWLLLIVSEGSFSAALLGAGWLYFSSFTQWWFSVGTPEEITGCAVSTIGAIYTLFARRRVWMAIGVALLGYGMLTLGLHLYPPFVLPLVYLGIFIVVGLLLGQRGLDAVRTDLGWRLGCLAVGMVPVAILALDYVSDARSTMQTMMNTVYPGHRYSGSGGLPWYRVMYGFFEAFRFDEQAFPMPPGNASEASSFLILAPVALLAIRPKDFLQVRSRLLLCMLAYCLMVFLWITVPLPVWIERPMQLGGWWLVPPFRAVSGLGIGSIVAVICLFARQQREARDRPLLTPPTALTIATFVIIWIYGELLAVRDPSFFSWQIIAAGALAGAVIATGAAFGRDNVLAAGIAFACIGTVQVNPLLSGISSIMEKPILVAAKKQGGGAHDKWAVIGDFLLAQGLKAQGLQVLNGSHVVPNRKLHSVLDPDGSEAKIWNRYAHVVLSSSPQRELPLYTKIGEDIYSIDIDVCGPQLRALGVTNVAYAGQAPAADKRCLIPLSAPKDAGVELYRLR